MGVIISKLASRVYELLKSKQYSLLMYNEYGDRVYEPESAYMFFAKETRMMVNIIDGETPTVRVNVSKDQDIGDIKQLIVGMRQAATHFGFLYTTQKYTKVLEPKDFALMATVKENAGEGAMSYGDYTRALLESEQISPEVARWAQIFQNLDNITSDGMSSFRGFQTDDNADVNRTRDLTQKDEYIGQAERWVEGRIGEGSPNHLKGPAEIQDGASVESKIISYISDVLRRLAAEDTILANIFARVSDQLERVAGEEKPDRWFTNNTRNKLIALVGVTGKKLGLGTMGLNEDELMEDWEDEFDRKWQEWDDLVAQFDAADCAETIFREHSGARNHISELSDEDKEEALDYMSVDVNFPYEISEYVLKNYDSEMYDTGDDLLHLVLPEFKKFGINVDKDGKVTEIKPEGEASFKESEDRLNEWFDKFDDDTRFAPEPTAITESVIVETKTHTKPFTFKEDRLGNLVVESATGGRAYVRGREASDFLNEVALNTLDLPGKEDKLYAEIERRFGVALEESCKKIEESERFGRYGYRIATSGAVVVYDQKDHKSATLKGDDAKAFLATIKERGLDAPEKELELHDFVKQYSVVMETVSNTVNNDVVEYFKSCCKPVSIEVCGSQVFIKIDSESLTLADFVNLCNTIGCENTDHDNVFVHGTGATIYGGTNGNFVESIEFEISDKPILEDEATTDTLVVPGHMEKDLIDDLGATVRNPEKTIKAKLREDTDTMDENLGFYFNNIGYEGSEFGDFYVRKDSSAGPGWFIFGRNSEKYGTNDDGVGNYVKLCGYVRIGKARNYNGKVRIGWPTKAAAEEALARINTPEPTPPSDPVTEDDSSDEIIARINDFIENAIEYETTHEDAGDGYSHLIREGDRADVVARVRHQAEQFGIGLDGVDDDVLFDWIVDNFRMQAGHIYEPQDVIVAASYPVGEVEIYIPYDGEFTKEFAQDHEREFDAVLNLNDDHALGYASTDAVWYAVIDVEDLESVTQVEESNNPHATVTDYNDDATYFVPGTPEGKIITDGIRIYKFVTVDGRPGAIGYFTGSKNNVFLYAFKSEESRDRYIEQKISEYNPE